jgi:hypothetical protein
MAAGVYGASAALSSRLTLLGSFAGGEAIAADPNVVILETLIRLFPDAASRYQQ